LDFFILFYKETEKYKSNNIYIFIDEISKQTPTTPLRKQNSITQPPNHPITQSPNQKKKEGVVGET
jgi:hypothetical protein